MTRRFSAVLGLVAGLATLLAAAGPASAIHIELRATTPSGTPSGTTIAGQVVPNPAEGVTATTPAIADIPDPLTLFGQVINDGGSTPGVTFTHTYSFGFGMGGEGAASATPNLLQIGTNVLAGFLEFEATVTGPGIGTVTLARLDPPTVPRRETLAATFAAIGTGTDTPYTLSITGQLLDGVTVANYSGNIGVVPLPGAAVLFLTALGGLAFARRYRRREEEGEEPAGAMAA